MSRPLTASLAIALADTIDRGGKLVRHQGGIWTEPGAVKTSRNKKKLFAWGLSDKTVNALVGRRELRFTLIRESKRQHGTLLTPIAAEVRG